MTRALLLLLLVGPAWAWKPYCPLCGTLYGELRRSCEALHCEDACRAADRVCTATAAIREQWPLHILKHSWTCRETRTEWICDPIGR